MKKNLYANVFHYKFNLKLSEQVGKSSYFDAISLPTHPLENQRQIYLNKYQKANHLNIELHRRLEECHKTNHFKMGEYEMFDFSGTVYLVWAQVERVNMNNVVQKEPGLVPVLFFKDGKNHFQKKIFLFHERLLVDIAMCTLEDIPSLWCLENKASTHAQKPLHRFKTIED